MKKTDIFLISDVHLGSGVSRAEALEKTLREWSFKKLILIGDIFDDLNFERLNPSHWKLLSYIHEISTSPNGADVVWIKGNHDELLTRVASHLLGIEVFEEYEWEYGGQKYIAIHGHQYDRFLVNNPFLSNAASFVYVAIQKIDFKQRKISRFIKQMSKRWLRLSEKIAASAMKYAKKKKARYVFCGHTHMPLEKHFGDINYYNTGCWTDAPSTFATIDKTGIMLHEVN